MVIRPPYKLAVCLMTAFWSIGLTAFAQSGVSRYEQLRGPAFVPDEKFKGSTLDGWHKLGQADWRVDNGELVGNGSAGSGWLVLDRSYQDAGFYAAFRCKGACDTGVLLRMTKTADGMTRYLLFREGRDRGSGKFDPRCHRQHSVSAEVEGCRRAVSLSLLRCLIQPRYPVSMRPYASEPAPPGVTLPVTMPHAHVREGEWNELEVMLDADIIRGYLNDTGRGSERRHHDDDLDAYGPIALYVGKGTEVRFKDVSYKDLAIKVQPLEKVGDRFRMQRVSPFYYNWTATDADFNHDGKLDIVSGAYLYYGPDFTKFREIYPARTFNPSTEYSTWVQHAYDVTGDGWADVVATDLGVGAVLYVNPGNESRRWKQYKIIPSMQSENSLLTDVDGDGKPELVYIADGCMRYAKPDPANPDRAVGGSYHLREGPLAGSRYRSRRHQRRWPHGYCRRARLVGTTGLGRRPSNCGSIIRSHLGAGDGSAPVDPQSVSTT